MPIFRRSLGSWQVGQTVCESAFIDSKASNSCWQASQM